MNRIWLGQDSPQTGALIDNNLDLQLGSNLHLQLVSNLVWSLVRRPSVKSVRGP